jgi:hypothetical protein
VGVLDWSERKFSFNFAARKANWSAVNKEGLNASLISLIASPDEAITNRAISYPILLPVEDEASFHFFGCRLKACRKAAELWLGKCEANHFFKS